MDVSVEKKTKKVKIPFCADKYDSTQKVVCRDDNYIVEVVAYFPMVKNNLSVCAAIKHANKVFLNNYDDNGKTICSTVDHNLDLMFEIEEEAEPEITIKCSKEELAFIGKCFGSLESTVARSLNLEGDWRDDDKRYYLFSKAYQELTGVNITYNYPKVKLSLEMADQCDCGI